jgi:hypothetical protein
MFRTIGDGPSPRESLLPPELLRLPEGLARVDALLDDPVFFAPFAPHFHPVIGLGRPAFSGPLNWAYFMLQAADSGTHRGLLAESGTRVLSEDVSDCTEARCTAQYPLLPSFSSGKLSGGRARLSGRR